MIQYPQTRKDDNVQDTFFQTNVVDPYRWLENQDAEETKTWVKQQNEITAKFCQTNDDYSTIQKKLEKHWNYPRYFSAKRKNNHVFYLHNEGLQDQAILFCKEGEKDPVVIFDPHLKCNDGLVALNSFHVSPDGKKVAYILSHKGSDEQDIHVWDDSEQSLYPEVIPHCRFSSLAWTADSQGFVYTRFPVSEDIDPRERFFNQKVYWHRLGTKYQEDVLAYERPDHKEWMFFPKFSKDGKYLTLEVYHGTALETRLYISAWNNGPVAFEPLFEKADALYEFLGSVDEKCFIRTTSNPKGKIVTIPATDREEKWSQLIPESENALEFASKVGDYLILVYSKDAYHQMFLYNIDGSLVKEIALPDKGTVTHLASGDGEFFFSFSSYKVPTTTFCYNIAQDTLEIFFTSDLDFSFEDLICEQVFYPSKDGTKVPMFILRHKDTTLDGNSPTILYGYGGFNNSLTPIFSPTRLIWLEHGGVYAIANLRGGNEYGEEWHKAGMLQNKQNVFDDFIAAGEYLIRKKYTCAAKLATWGGSNGGLLVAACMIQRPDLFGAVVCRNAVLDMLRYHRFTIGHYWICEYGDPDNNEQDFANLYRYSPLHNVKEKAEYPPILITTADHDDRVVPGHAKKFAATLQEKKHDNGVILLDVGENAGHGAGKPITKNIIEYTDAYSFLGKVFQMSFTR